MMTDRELEAKLRGAVEHAAPNDVAAVLARCSERKGEQTMEPVKRKTHLGPWLAAACLALILVGGGMLHQLAQNRVASVVSLDVNPSVELQVNRQERVVSAQALNGDAEAILEGMDLRGTELKVAVNAVVGSLMQHGYLSDLSSTILISVEDRDQNHAKQLEDSLRREVGASLEKNASSAAILAQTVADEDGLRDEAARNNISLGKAALVRQVQEINGSLPFDALAGLSIGELKALEQTGAPGLPVGKQAAAEAALAHAGLTGSDAVVAEVEQELDDSHPHYEVELKTLSGEFEYEVDAYTGQVLEGQKDLHIASPAGAITQETARETALTHAGVQAEGAEVTPEFDHGRPTFEVEFRHDGREYEYEIDAATGVILDWEIEADDEDDDLDDFDEDDDLEDAPDEDDEDDLDDDLEDEDDD